MSQTKNYRFGSLVMCGECVRHLTTSIQKDNTSFGFKIKFHCLKKKKKPTNIFGIW